MSERWSLAFTKTEVIGRAYFKSNSYSVLLLKLLHFACIYGGNANGIYVDFLKELMRVEIHETLHLFFAHTLKKWQCSEKVIKSLEGPMLNALAEILAKDYTDMYLDVYEWIREHNIDWMEKNKS